MEYPISKIKKTLQYWCFNETLRIPYSSLSTNIKGIFQGLTICLTENTNIPPYFEYPKSPELINVYVHHMTFAIQKCFQDQKRPVTLISDMMKEVSKTLQDGEKLSKSLSDIVSNDPLTKISRQILQEFLEQIDNDLDNQKTFALLCRDYPYSDLPHERKSQIKSLTKKIDNLDMFHKNPYLATPDAPLVILDAFSVSYHLSFRERVLGSLVTHLTKHYQIEGHSCYPLKKLLKQVVYQTNHSDLKDINDVEKELANSERFFEIIEDESGNDYIYLKSNYYKETFIAKQIKAIHDRPSHLLDTDHVIERIADYEDEHNVILTQEQKNSVIAVFAETDILVITGYPGTGKSMVTNCIKYVFEQVHPEKFYDESKTDPPILFAAPTGIAATRLGKGKGMTLHRALQVALDSSKEFVFRKNAKNPFLNDMIIIDEVSMLDMELAYQLLSAFMPGKTKLVLIGDENQLQSVGPGDILHHIIGSGIIKTVHLRKIFRQSDSGLKQEINPIVGLAKTIIKGKVPKKSQLQNDNITYIPLNDREAIYKKVLDLFDTLSDDCQIILPTKKESTVGSITCNKVIAASKHDGLSSKSKFNIGDKVVCTKNTVVTNEEGDVVSDLSVFNGEIGTVRYVDNKADEVSFETTTGKSITIKPDALDHGWCITCNKSQGSEYNNVILVLHESQSVMLTRQLVYTAITRAKKHLYLIGTLATLKKAISTPVQRRYSFLSSFIASEDEV